MKTAIGCLVKGLATLVVLVIITMINVEADTPSGAVYIIAIPIIGAIWFMKWSDDTAKANNEIASNDPFKEEANEPPISKPKVEPAVEKEKSTKNEDFLNPPRLDK